MFPRALVPAACIVLAITPIAVVGGAAPQAAVQVFADRGLDIRPDPKTKAEIVRMMATKGFGVVDLKAGRAFSIDRADDVKSAVEAARNAGADLLVLGRTSTSGEAGRRSLAGTVSATISITRVELRAIRADTSDIVWPDAETS